MKISHLSSLFIILIALVITLIYGQSLIIPFVLAVLIWFIIKELREIMQGIPFIKEKAPSWLLSVLAFLGIGVVLAAISNLLGQNIQNLSKSLPNYQGQIDEIALLLEKNLGVNYKESLSEYAVNIDFGNIVEMLINSISDIIGNTVMIVLYLIFLLLEEQVFQKKLKALYPDQDKYNKIKVILQNIDRSVGKYIFIKTFISLITGGLSFIALKVIGVEAAAFWAALIFLLNYIPTIGSLIGTLFPAFFALLQFGELNSMLYVLGSVGLIQIVVGNVIEPKLMGDSLNLSALVVILSLSFWGAIWGITGMILSVPITVAIVIVCAAFPSTKRVAILLSENAEL